MYVGRGFLSEVPLSGAPKGGVGGGIWARPASRPAGRRANPPEADIVGSSTSVEWGVAE